MQTSQQDDFRDIGICPHRQRKKMLHILNSEPDATQRAIINGLSRGYHTMEFPLYEENTDKDYDELLSLLFQYDQIVTWW